jgi:[ribosomal protein S5]-alanine N-acetyltransferase
MVVVETDRLVLRAPIERDRARFVELFTDEAFTVFSDGVHDTESANARFDGMLSMIEAIPYAKQPIIERSSGAIIGYTGVATAIIDGVDRLEWGWRLVPDARGSGYATEATRALLDVADAYTNGEMLCIIAPENHASKRVADKVGFRWWRQLDWNGDPADPVELLVRPIGTGGAPLLAQPRD